MWWTLLFTVQWSWSKRYTEKLTVNAVPAGYADRKTNPNHQSPTTAPDTCTLQMSTMVKPHLVKIITLGMMALTVLILVYSCKIGITFPNIATNGVKYIYIYIFFCQYVSLKQKLFCFQLLSCFCDSKISLSWTTSKNFSWASKGRWPLAYGLNQTINRRGVAQLKHEQLNLIFWYNNESLEFHGGIDTC